MSSRRLRELGDGHRWDEADARAALKAWRSSGLSGKKFAEHHGFNPQRLFWWKKRLQEERVAAAADEERVRFVAAEVVGGEDAFLATAVVRGRGGVAVEVDADSVSPAWVAAVARELAEA